MIGALRLVFHRHVPEACACGSCMRYVPLGLSDCGILLAFMASTLLILEVSFCESHRRLPLTLLKLANIDKKSWLLAKIVDEM